MTESETRLSTIAALISLGRLKIIWSNEMTRTLIHIVIELLNESCANLNGFKQWPELTSRWNAKWNRMCKQKRIGFVRFTKDAIETKWSDIMKQYNASIETNEANSRKRKRRNGREIERQNVVITNLDQIPIASFVITPDLTCLDNINILATRYDIPPTSTLITRNAEVLPSDLIDKIHVPATNLSEDGRTVVLALWSWKRV